MGKARQDYDNLAWDLNDAAWGETRGLLQCAATFQRVLTVAENVLKRPTRSVKAINMGGYNVLYQIDFEDSTPDVMLRVPIPHFAQFPDEKTLHEVATIRLLQKQTRMPIAPLLGSGYDGTLGSFLIMPYIRHSGDMVDVLCTPGDPDIVPILRDDISHDALKQLYGHIAEQMIHLSRPIFPRIGSLRETEGAIEASGRPVTQNMNNMAQLANIPRAVLPDKDTSYSTADEWYCALAKLHMVQLIFQRNDLVTSEEDCRNKYVARVIFRRLAEQGKLSSFGFQQDTWSAQSQRVQVECPAPSNSSGFRLWCDDLRPRSFLVDHESRIVSAIDWEFTYAAPTQFTLDPPWWLLLEMPEMWQDGIDEWSNVYEQRLDTWLCSMEEAESRHETVSATDLHLSKYMRESWTAGRFWLSYAARKSWAFDTIYWEYLDERFFPERDPDLPLWNSRLHLLSDREKAIMEDVVAQKMDEMKQRILVEWDKDEAIARLDSILY